MKHTACLYIVGLVILLSVFLLIAVPAWAQEIVLRSVEPSGAHAGEEVDVFIRGRGFCGPATVRIGEFQAGEVRVESDTLIGARVFIPENAQPGRRDVEVVVDCGGPEETFGAVLPDGFTVLEPVGAGGRESGDDGRDYEDRGVLDWWPLIAILILGGAVVLGGGALVVTLTMVHRARLKQRAKVRQVQQNWEQLQAEAEEGDLPETCRSDERKVIRDRPEIVPGLWRVVGLGATLYDEARVQRDGERRGKARSVPDELVERIDIAVRNKSLWGDSEGLAVEIAEIGRALAAQVIAWQAISEIGHDVVLEPEIEGGEGSIKFTLYRCVGSPDWWQEVSSWEVEVQAVKHFQQAFRGPTVGESPEVYRAVLEKGITAYVANLLREASRLWDTKGVGVSVEVSLEREAEKS
jgi:hypothetical protein